MQNIIRLYKNAYSGLNHPTWMLAFVQFVNRCGTMVLPFMSLYVTKELQFTLKQSGVVLSFFGIGSMAGALLGGWLTDKFGSFVIQFLSLLVGGILFFVILQLSEFYQLIVGIFFLGAFAESLRPANSASIVMHTNQENLTRAFSLNRMAINLGFSIGPAIGGLLAAMSFKFLFVADGITCIVSGMIFFLYFKNRKPVNHNYKKNTDTKGSNDAYRDKLYLLFIVITCCYGIMLFQLLTTLPLYYSQIYQLNQEEIGLLLGANGVLIFLVEMILVYSFANKYSLKAIIIVGLLLTGLSYSMLNWVHSHIYLYLSMIILSFSEILVMPFLATIATKRASSNKIGSYMGLYTVAYSAAIVIGPYVSTRIISNYGYEQLWNLIGVFSIAVSAGCYFLLKRMKVA